MQDDQLERLRLFFEKAHQQPEPNGLRKLFNWITGRRNEFKTRVVMPFERESKKTAA